MDSRKANAKPSPRPSAVRAKNPFGKISRYIHRLHLAHLLPVGKGNPEKGGRDTLYRDWQAALFRAHEEEAYKHAA